jgi:hypothetical protein
VIPMEYSASHLRLAVLRAVLCHMLYAPCKTRYSTSPDNCCTHHILLYVQVTAAAKANQTAAKGTKSIQSFFGGKK